MQDLSTTFQFPLDDFQQQAVQLFLQGNSVLVCAPTGAGKTAIAEAAAVAVLARYPLCTCTASSIHAVADFAAVMNRSQQLQCGLLLCLSAGAASAALRLNCPYLCLKLCLLPTSMLGANVACTATDIMSAQGLYSLCLYI